MQRQIKFRVCYTVNGEKSMIQSDDCQFFMRLNGSLYENYGRHEKPMWENVFDADYIIQQFTGLLDANNKEIYEGDIVSGVFYDTEYHHSTTIRSPVTFVGGAFNISSTYWHKPSLKIIGNIFENPELLS